MNTQFDSNTSHFCKLIIGFTALSLLVALSCATARLDPERNQALTFDTVPAIDAGVPPERSNGQLVKHAPSQPASSASEAQPTHADTRTAGEPLTCTVDPPDPKPSRTRDWLVYEFSYKQGVVSVLSRRHERIQKLRDSARVTGRYCVELWIGCELLERVRFGFPLQAAETVNAPSTRHPLHEPPSFTAHAELRTTVRVPLELRATRAELVDRGTGQRTALAWPPNLPELATGARPAPNPQDSSFTAPAKGSLSQPEKH